MYGIKETLDGARFLGTLISNIVDAAIDGQFAWWEVVKFQQSAALLPAAVSGYAEIPKEIGDLDENEAIALNSAFAETLDLPADDKEALIEEGVALSLATLAYINKVRAARQRANETPGA